MRWTDIVTRRRAAGQSGLTLLEVLLTVGVLAFVMIPLLAWTVLAMQRANDTATAEDTTAFTQVSQFLSRDVASAVVVDAWSPGVAGAPSDPCGVDPTGTYAAGGDTWLVLRDAEGRNVVYVSDDDGEGGSHRLLRRECGFDQVQTDAPVVLAEGLRELPVPEVGGEEPVLVSCKPREGLEEECGVVAMTLQAQKANPVTLRAVRRVDDANARRLSPTAIIRCLPDCVGERDGDKSFTVVLDGTRSSTPSGDPLVEWDFPDNPEFPAVSSLRTDELTFVCTRDTTDGDGDPLWNDQLEGGGGCEFEVGLRIKDQETGQTASTQITVIVLNAKPVVRVARNPVHTHRVEPVLFDASETVDADDPDGEELEFEWYFDDPALTAGDSNTATGPVAEHTYHEETEEGEELTATLTVTDNEGYVTVVEIPVRVSNHPPVAIITGDSVIDAIPLTEEVVWSATSSPLAPNTSSHDPDGKVTPTGREAEYDLDRAPKRQGPNGEELSRYEWVLLDADGEPVLLDQNGNQVVLPPGADPADHPELRGASWSGPTAMLAPPGLTVPGVYTINLTVYDVDDPSISTTASKVIDVNEQPRSVIVEGNAEPQPDPGTGVITITPEMPGGTTTIKLDGGEPDGSSGSFDPDDEGMITNYRWEFWTPDGGAPENECTSSPSPSPPCYIDGGPSPEIEFGPGASNPAHRIPHGRYRVQLRVEDTSRVPNQCFWHNPWNEPAECVDDRPDLLRPANPWVEVFINWVPSFSGVTYTSTPNPKAGEVYRRTDVHLSPIGTVTDPDGSIASFEWSFERLTAPTSQPILMSSATGLLSEHATVHFHEPDRDYQVRATLRVTDDVGGYRERSTTFTVRNKPPRAGITVLNLQTGDLFGNPNVPWATSADPANDDSVVFQLDAGPARDDDGSNGTQAPYRSWRIYKKAVGGGQHQLLARFGEYNLSSTCTIHEETLPGWEPELLGQECFNFRFRPLEHGTYIVTQEVWDDLGERNEGWAETEFHVHHPPDVELHADFNGNPSTSCVPGGISTSCTLGFTTDANDDVNGGHIVEYTYDWGDGSPVTVRTNGNRVTHLFDSALTNPDGSCRTNTGICGQWDVKVTVQNNTYGTASAVVRVRVNSRPVAVLMDPATGEPAGPDDVVRIRVNCPPLPDDGDTGDCEMPAFDASPSYDPDGSIVEYWWYDGIYNATNPEQNRLGITEDPTPDPSWHVQVGYSLSRGREMRLVVVDDDGVRSNPLAFRLNSNRAPRNVNITQPSGAQPVPVQRNVPTNWQGTTAEDGGDRLTFTWRFERVSDGSPIEFLDPDGNLVTSYTTPAVNTSGTTTQSPLSALAFPAAVQGRAILEATDDLGLSATSHVEFRFDVVDAAPVAVIRPVPEADNPIVFTDVGDDVPEQAYSVTFDGSDSYDPDANGDGGPGPVTTYQWTVTRATGGTVCSGTDPQLTCNLPNEFGTFRVRLQVGDAGGRTHFTTWDVRVNRPPTAVVSPETVVETGAPLTVDFSAAGSQDGRPGYDDPPGPGAMPGGGLVSYTWSWGDGSPDTVVAHPDQSASHTYTEPGTYVVTLTVTDTDGATDTATATVKVNEAPLAAIEVSRGAEECTTLDGPRGCVLNAPGPYTITLDGGGSSDVDGSIVGYAWTIEGPGYSEVGSDASFDVTLPDSAGTYEIHLTVTDDNGAEGTATAYVTINAAPVAVIGGPDPLELHRGAEFTFDGSGSSDADGAIESYRWEFLDEEGNPIGEPVVTASPTLAHAIDQLVPAPGRSGSGTVRLTVTDDDGGTGSAEKSFTVGNQLPVPVVSTEPDPAVISPDNPDGRPVVTLDGSESYDPDDPGAPLSHEWTVRNVDTDATFTVDGATVDLGPGTTPPLPVGRYEVTLEVTDGDGDVATSAPVEVIVNASPVADPQVSPTVVNPGEPGVISFDGSASTDADGTIERYEWQVTGPGGYESTFEGATPHDLTLTGPGTYVVRLTVTDDLGGIGTATVAVRFNEAPAARFVVRSGDDTCDPVDLDECVVNAPFSFQLDGLASTDDQSVVGYEWEVVDASEGVVASGDDPVLDVTLPGTGTYEVRLRVRDGDDVWSEVVTGAVRANEAPTAVIGGDEVLELRRGAPFTFDATASTDPDGDGIATYLWELLDEDGVEIASSGPQSEPLHDMTVDVLVPALGMEGQGTVRLTVVDVDGASSAVVTKPFVVLNQAPVAKIVQTPDASVGSPGYSVHVRSDSHDPDGQIVLHQWIRCDVTDPEALVCEEPVEVDVVNGNQFTFPDYGWYVIKLVVGDDLGAVVEDEVPIKINRPPVAAIEGCCDFSVAVGAPLVLNGGDGFSEDPDGEIVLYIWQFDGPEPVDPGFEPSIVRTFDTPGQYQVTLEVLDDDGEMSAPVTATIEVTEVAP